MGERRPALSRLGMTPGTGKGEVGEVKGSMAAASPSVEKRMAAFAMRPVCKDRCKEKNRDFYEAVKGEAGLSSKMPSFSQTAYCYCLCVYPQPAHPSANVARIQVNQL